VIESLPLIHLVWIGAAIFFGYAVRGMSGFGAGMVSTPLMAFVLPAHVAIPVSGLLAFALFCILSVRDRGDVIWREFRLLVVPTLAGVGLGLLVFKSLDGGLLLRALGLFLMLYAVYMVAASTKRLPELRCSERWALPAGFVGATIDTLFGGGGGTLVVIYIHARGLTVKQFRATVAMVWFIEMIARIGAYSSAGYYTSDVLMLVGAMLPLMWIGTKLGEKIGNRVSPATFSRLLAGVLFLSGANHVFH
jgi:uncharacterized membrane protein YfcA